MCFGVYLLIESSRSGFARRRAWAGRGRSFSLWELVKLSDMACSIADIMGPEMSAKGGARDRIDGRNVAVDCSARPRPAPMRDEGVYFGGLSYGLD